MADTQGKTKTKRLSKGERTHQRRLKQAGRKPGGAMALQMAKAKAAAAVASKKDKASSGAAATTSSPANDPKE